MLTERFDRLEEKIDTILALHRSLPTWYPLTKEYATECGYKTVEGLKKWCYNNLHPDDFVKRGKHWFIHVRSLPQIKRKVNL